MERDHRANETATGAALVLIGFVFLLDRLSALVIRYVPRLEEVQQWWPVLLIGSGLVLLLWCQFRQRNGSEDSYDQ